ncbi:MAG: FAD-dependent monooxygenase [Rickettsiaceae bacterium]|nr:FAD-dependent monooxygenase [Rickettsiaceae bacterium]
MLLKAIKFKKLMQNNGIIVIGAGISGLSIGILLSRLGYRVTIFEKRPIIYSELYDERSINFTISQRGLNSLIEIGIDKDVLSKACQLDFRCVHNAHGKTDFHYYDIRNNIKNNLWSIKRSDLLYCLYKKAIETNIVIHFDRKLVDIDFAKNTAYFISKEKNKIFKQDFVFVIGADGSFSDVSKIIIPYTQANYSVNFFPWQYCRVSIDAEDSASLKLANNGLHIWPGQRSIIFGLPNLDFTVSCMICFKKSDAEINKSDIKQYLLDSVRSDFSYLLKYNSFLTNLNNIQKSSSMVTTYLSQWFFEKKIVLLGDACHSVFPFYGQGMNIALEDCLVLYNRLKNNTSNIKENFQKYESLQKLNAHALSKLSEEHFNILSNKISSSFYKAKIAVDNFLSSILGNKWLNEHSLVTNGHVNFKKINKILKIRRLIRWCSGIFIIELAIGCYFFIGKIFNRL